MEIRGRTEGVKLQAVILGLILVVPAGALIQEISVLMIVLSSLWLAFFGRIMLEVMKSDLRVRINVHDRTIEITNINPLMAWFRRRIKFRFFWEGVHPWDMFRRVVVREKKYGKYISNREFRLLMESRDRREYPLAEFTNALLAENVAYILARLTGTQYLKIRAH